METETAIPQPRKREEHLSADGNWRSFPRVPNLLQYVNSGVYFGRLKINGRLVRKSLKTAVWTTAKVRLVDFLKENQELKGKVLAPEFKAALELMLADLSTATHMKESSKQYRRDCVTKLKATWPELWELSLDEITVEACKEWAGKLSKQIAGQYFNNMLGTLRMIITAGIADHKRKTGILLPNPALEVKRVKVKRTELNLPNPEKFDLVVANIRSDSGGWGPRVADMAEFLAYSGMRVYSEARWVTVDDLDWEKKEIKVRGDPVTATKNSEVRRVPMIPRMEKLLTRMIKEYNLRGSDRILQVNRGYESLARACRKVGIPKLNHKALRHLFGTYCIEAGVDIPTVADWLGHKDRGVLAMQTYRHLRNEHSQAMAQKVNF